MGEGCYTLCCFLISVGDFFPIFQFSSQENDTKIQFINHLYYAEPVYTFQAVKTQLNASSLTNHSCLGLSPGELLFNMLLAQPIWADFLPLPSLPPSVPDLPGEPPLSPFLSFLPSHRAQPFINQPGNIGKHYLNIWISTVPQDQVSV